MSSEAVAEPGEPEGDTLFRTAAGLRPHLVGRAVTAARATRAGPKSERLVGATVDEVETLGKNLVSRFDNGLELRTQMRMSGSWHRYRPGERWRRPAARARLVLEVPGAVAVCFDAPAVELFEQRAERQHHALAGLGPDLLDPDFDAAEAIRRLRDPARADVAIAEALTDQRSVAGIGNVYKSELCFLLGVTPWLPIGALPTDLAVQLPVLAKKLLEFNRDRPARVTTGRREQNLFVYGRASRPCMRCGTRIRSANQGDGSRERPTYWCPRCQTGPTPRPGGHHSTPEYRPTGYESPTPDQRHH